MRFIVVGDEMTKEMTSKKKKKKKKGKHPDPAESKFCENVADCRSWNGLANPYES